MAQLKDTVISGNLRVTDTIYGHNPHHIYYVKGTQTTSTNAFKGNLPEVETLYEGLAIDYWLPFAGVSNTAATLELTLKNNISSGAIPIYYIGNTVLTTHLSENSIGHFVYQTNTIDNVEYTGWWLLKTYFLDTTYSQGSGITISGTTINNAGVRAIATGSSNGTISVNTNGTSTDVAVKGLGSAAYSATTDYAPSIHEHTSLKIHEISTSTDLNTLTDAGWYVCRLNTIAATLTNCPTQLGFFMEVQITAWNDSNQYGIYQHIIDYKPSVGKQYIRRKWNTTWDTNWQQLTQTVTDNVTNGVLSLAIG